MKVPAEHLRSVLGIRTVSFIRGHNQLAIMDSPLSDGAVPAAAVIGAPASTASAAKVAPRLPG
jgi:hypothetical protein